MDKIWKLMHFHIPIVAAIYGKFDVSDGLDLESAAINGMVDVAPTTSKCR